LIHGRLGRRLSLYHTYINLTTPLEKIEVGDRLFLAPKKKMKKKLNKN